jgi:phytoene dehydrogenase-like protein
MSAGKVAIIGAGLSGLAAGCYARMNDFQTTIFEQLGWPGGLARSWERDGFQLDPGPNLIWAVDPGTSTHDALRELGVLPRRSVKRVKRWEIADQDGRRKVNLISPLDELEAELKRISPEDVELIEDVIEAASRIDPVQLLDSFESKAPDLAGLTDSLAGQWKARRYQRYLRGQWSLTMSEWAARIKDPFLRGILSSLSPPESPAWLGLTYLSLVAKGHLRRLDQGADGLVQDLVERFQGLGGEIRLKSLVTGILLDGDQVRGLTLRDEKEPASSVITAIDGYEVIHGMLEGRFVDEEIERRYRQWKPSNPRVSISIGAAGTIDDLMSMQTILLDRPLIVGTTPNHRLVVRSFDHEDGYAPPGKTLLSITLDSDWQFWYKLRALDAQMYADEKARIGDEVLHDLQGIYPSISEAVEMVEVSTPYTTWRLSRAREGAPCGWSITHEALSSFPIRALPGLSGLYMAGPWAVPTIGIAGCLFSGKHAVQMLCHDQGRSFKTIAPVN